MNKTTLLANMAIEAHGYVVMAFMPGPRPLPSVGEKLDEVVDGVQGPFFIASESSAEEYILQTRKFNAGALPAAQRVAARAIGFFRLVAE